MICPDNRGVGGSALGDDPLSVEAMAADVLALLDHLGIDRPPVAGWSMGGFVAQRLARVAPERVSALVLLSTDPGGAAARRAPAAVWARLTDHTGSPREQARRLIGLLFPPAVAAAVDRDFGEIVAAARAALSADSLAQQELAMAAWHEGAAEAGAARPPPVLVPVLAAAGSLDEVIPAENVAALAGGEGDWAARFGGGGHGFMAQEPERLAALISAFLGVGGRS